MNGDMAELGGPRIDDGDESPVVDDEDAGGLDEVDDGDQEDEDPSPKSDVPAESDDDDAEGE